MLSESTAEEINKTKYLVSPANEIKVLFIQELGHFVSSKSIGNTPVILTPASDVPIGIRPKEVTQETLIWHVYWPLYGSDLI